MSRASREPRIWLIAGATASGKSALALRLARETGAEIVNADSMQLYAELRILSARPSRQDEALAPHHLFGVAPAREAWSVGRWLRSALAVLAAIQERGRPTIFVGGTGLYFRALTQGLAEIPPTPPSARARAVALLSELGESGIRERLALVDPASEAKILPGDRQRLTRALEVFLASGRPLSDWRRETKPALAAGSWRSVVLAPPVESLYRRGDERLAAMEASGVLEEVERLRRLNLSPQLPAMKALGVAAFASCLRGETSLAAAMERARGETRRYAKRQMTWFRNQTPDWPRIEAEAPAGQWVAFVALNHALTFAS